MNPIPTTIRRAEDSDISFVYNSWLKNYKESPDNKIFGSSYYLFQKHLIRDILDRASILLVCDEKDSWHIYSYIVYEIVGDIFIIHWVYTKGPFREFGFARSLIETIRVENIGLDDEVVITHRGKFYKFVSDKIKHIYKPELAFRREIKE
jgi:hypothetical protein